VEYKYKPMVLMTVIISVMTPCVSLLLIYNTALREKALIIGYLSVQCIAGLIFYIYQFCKGKCFYDREYWSYAVKFNIPLIPHYLSLMVLAQSDRLMIKSLCSESDAGIYGFAYQIASTLSVMSSAINGSRVPWTYEQLRDKKYTGLRKITISLVVLMASITLMVNLMSPDIITVLGTREYLSAVYVIPIVTLGVYFTFCYDLYASIEFYYGSTKYVMIASFVGAVLNLALNRLFLPIFGFIAAAYTTLVCYMVLMIMHYLFSCKVLKDQNISEKVYDNRLIFMISLLTTVIGLSFMLTYKVPVFRYLLIAVIIAVIFIKRNVILSMISTIKNR